MRRRSWAWLAGAVLCACGNGAANQPAPDAAVDAVDAAQADAGADVAADVAAQDVVPDAVSDSVADAVADAGPGDGVADSQPDAADGTGDVAQVPDTEGADCDGADCGVPLCPGAPPPNTECVDGQWVCKPDWFWNVQGVCEPFSCAGVGLAHDVALGKLVEAHNACSTSADCVYVMSDTACKGSCGAVIAQAQADAFAQELEALDLTWCKNFAYALKCGYMTPGCLAPTPACEGGKCKWSPTLENCPGDKPKDGGVCIDGQWTCQTGYVLVGDTCKTFDCQTVEQALSGQVADLVAASNACTQDADCVVASTGTACQGTCGAAIHKDQQAAFGSALASIDAHLCVDTGYAGKCGYATPDCMVASPGCSAGKCVYAK